MQEDAMKKATYQVKISGEERQYPVGTAFSEIAAEYQMGYEDDIVMVMFNNRLKELHKTVKADGELTFVTTRDKAGRKAACRPQSVGGGWKAGYRACGTLHQPGIFLRAVRPDAG